ncbi:hypothetical protein ACOSQ2_005237 [Xanthoceras sorbifolium]
MIKVRVLECNSPNVLFLIDAGKCKRKRKRIELESKKMVLSVRIQLLLQQHSGHIEKTREQLEVPNKCALYLSLRLIQSQFDLILINQAQAMHLNNNYKLHTYPKISSLHQHM